MDRFFIIDKVYNKSDIEALDYESLRELATTIIPAIRELNIKMRDFKKSNNDKYQNSKKYWGKISEMESEKSELVNAQTFINSVISIRKQDQKLLNIHLSSNRDKAKTKYLWFFYKICKTELTEEQFKALEDKVAAFQEKPEGVDD